MLTNTLHVYLIVRSVVVYIQSYEAFIPNTLGLTPIIFYTIPFNTLP